jgi:hypothetical protein
MNWRNTPTVRTPFRPCRTKIAMQLREIEQQLQLAAAHKECIEQSRPVTRFLGLPLIMPTAFIWDSCKS